MPWGSELECLETLSEQEFNFGIIFALHKINPAFELQQRVHFPSRL
jgi:hypothetical protein